MSWFEKDPLAPGDSSSALWSIPVPTGNLGLRNPPAYSMNPRPLCNPIGDETKPRRYLRLGCRRDGESLRKTSWASKRNSVIHPAWK